MSFSPAAITNLFIAAASGIATCQQLSHTDIAAAGGDTVVSSADGSLTLRAAQLLPVLTILATGRPQATPPPVPSCPSTR